MRLFLSFVLCAAFGAQAWAGPAKWQVDAAKSSLQFTLKINGQIVTGTFKAFGALIVFDPADLAHSSVKLTIDMTEARTGNATYDATLLKPDWFNVLDHPQAVFHATTFTAKGGDAYEARGTLTMKGVTRQVTLPFTLKIAGRTAVMKGETVLQRLAFNVGQGPDFQSAVPVALEVKVMVNVTAKRAAN